METGEPKKRGRKKSIPKAPDAYPYDSDLIHTKDYRLDPIGYCHDVLGIKSFTPMQERIFQLAMTPPYRVLVACGHGVGKSYGAACAVSWFFDSYPNGCALVTAPTHRDIVDVIFRNVRKQRLNAGLGGFVGNVVPELRGEAPDNYAKGFTAEKGESFSGRHQEHMLFIFDEACHDAETDVMTEDGWKRFSDLDGHERLLTMHPETHVAEYVLPVKIVKKCYQGDLIQYEAKKANWCVTPGHNMYWRPNWYSYKDKATAYGQWQKSSMADLMNRSAATMTRSLIWPVRDQYEFVVPEIDSSRKHFPARSFDGDDWVRLLGWYCSEGSLVRAGRHHEIYGFSVTQKAGQEADEIYALFETLGLQPKKYPTGRGDCVSIQCYSLQIGRWLAQFGEKCTVKRIPECVRMASARQISLFLETYARGDGYRHGNCDVIYTSSPRMADDLQELIVKSGGEARVSKRTLVGVAAVFKDHVSASTCDGYVIRWVRKATQIKYRTKNTSRVPYAGFVYCAELPIHHLLLTRRKGCVLWSGNTGIEPNFWETTSSMFHAKPGHHWIVYFNPLDTSCEAYRQWETGGWHKVQMGCLDHPNVVAGLAKQPEPYPGAVSVQQVDSWVKQWCDPVGEMEREETDIIWPPEEYSTPDRPSQWQRPSPRMEARALGRWPSSDLFGVWSRYAWQKCCMPVEWKPTLTILPEFGVDVAYTGEDYTVIHGRWGPKSFHHERHNGWSPRQTAARLKVLCAEAAALANTIRPHDAHMVEPEQIVAKVDADGMGVNVIDNAGGFCFRPVCGSGRAMRHEQYYNKRAESWFQVCQFAKDGICSVADLPQDTRDRLGKQLLCPKHKIDSRSGLIILEPKEETKKRLSVSPDDGDAFILAYAHAGNISSLAWEIQALSGVEQTRDRTAWEPPRTRQRGATAFNVPNYEDEDATRHAERRFWNFGV